jgi:hypothetical protein
MSEAQPFTQVFAPEIENSIVSILWHEPERCGQFFRELDPRVHLMQPALRIIAKAIDLAFRELFCELGTSDFTLVVQVVRELRGFEEVGGLEGLNQIYARYEYRSSKEAIDQIFTEYIRLLKAYAAGRKEDPPAMPYRFNRGDINLVENKNKRSVSSPHYVGEGKVAGYPYRAAAWKVRESLVLSLLPK